MRRSGSSGSIKSEALSVDGAMPPSRKDGWAKFQEWNQQWNRFFATLFCILAFSLLFAIVVVNVINAERESDKPSGGNYNILEKATIDYEQYEDFTSTTVEEKLSTSVKVNMNIKDPDDSLNSDQVKDPPGHETNPENDCVMSSHCSFFCKSMMSSDVNATMNRLLEAVYCTAYNLRLEEITFASKAIRRGWISLTKGLRFLEIINSNVEIIEANAFNERQYEQLTDLRLSKLPIRHLVANTFSGLTLLEYLELRELPLEIVAPTVLDPLTRKLKTFLLFHNLNPIDPYVFTGSVNLNNLESLAMQNNNFGDVVNKKTFKNLPKLINLTFNDNNITNLTSDAFDSIGRQLRVIRLDGNSLETVPKGIFSRIKSRQFRVLLEQNPWDCDCHLLELQYYLRVDREWFSDNPLCATPSYLAGKLIRDAEFCVSTERPRTTEITSTTTELDTSTTTVLDCVSEKRTDSTTEFYGSTTTGSEATNEQPGTTTATEGETTTTTTGMVTTTSAYPTTPFSTSPRTHPTVPTTTEPPPDCSLINKKEICGGERFSASCLLPHLSVKEHQRRHQISATEKVHVNSPSFTIKIKEVERFTIEIHVKRRYGGHEKYFILWFSDETTETGLISNDAILADCQCSQQEDVYIQQLPPSTLYVFCVMIQSPGSGGYEHPGYEGYVNSPFDCLPYKTMPTKAQEAWLTYEDRWTVTSLTLLIFMCCGVFGALTMYLTIRRVPTLLRGSERVVIVNNNQVKVYGSKSLKKTDSVISSNIASIQSRPLPDIQQSTYLTPIPRKISLEEKKLGSRRASDSSIHSGKANHKGGVCYCAIQDKKCFYDLKDVPKTPPPLPNRSSIVSEYINIVRSPENEIYTEFSYDENIYSKTELDCSIETF